MSSLDIRHSGFYSAVPVYRTMHLSLTMVKGWKAQILRSCSELETLLSERTPDSPRLNEIIQSLSDLYKEANERRLERIHPHDSAHEIEIKSIISFIHNSKNKVNSAKELIFKGNHEKACALISSIHYQEKLSTPENRTLTFMIQTFDQINAALTEKGMAVEIQTNIEPLSPIMMWSSKTLQLTKHFFRTLLAFDTPALNGV